MGPEAEAHGQHQGNNQAAHEYEQQDQQEQSEQHDTPHEKREVSQATPTTKINDRDDEQPSSKQEEELQLGDFIGEHGAYQLSLTLLLFVRYVFLGLMANSGPLMTPDVTFYCKLPEREILMIMPNISLMSERERELELKEEFKQICQIDLHLYQNQSSSFWAAQNSSLLLTSPPAVARHSSAPSQANNFRTISISAPSSFLGGAGSGRPISSNKSAAATTRTTANLTADLLLAIQQDRIRECTEFTYELARDQGRTMTSEFDLVCDRDWLRSLFQSLLSAAIVVAHVFWGTFSDKYGRFQAQRICLVVSFLSGTLSIFAWDFWCFTLARALCSFGDLGLVVSMTTTLVELVGSKYRGCSVALVNFGYALGVSLLPYIVAYFEDFQLVIGFTVLCHMVTMPLVLATNESVRWLLTNRRFRSAKRELKRIARINRRFNKLPATAAGATTAGGRREQKRKFELKFEEFIRQIESQDMCDPNVTELAASTTTPMLARATPPSRPQAATAAREQQSTSGLEQQVAKSSSATTTSAEPFNLDCPAPSGVSHLIRRGQIFATPSLIVSPPPDFEPDEMVKLDAEPHVPARPRLLENLDLEQLRRIKEVEEGVVSSTTSSDGTPYVRKRTYSCGLLNDALIRSLEMRHQQRRPLMDAAATGQLMMDKTLTLPHRVSSSGYGGGGISKASSVESQLSGIGRVYSSLAAVSSLQDLRRRPHYNDANRRGDDYHAGCARPPECINLVAHQLSFVGRVSRLFKDKKLMIAVFTIVWTTFNSELLYTSFIIINLDVGDDVYLNYMLGGCMEALAAIAASLLLSYAPRRISLITFWLLISFACFGLSLAHIDSTWAVWALALAKFSQSCLSSIATVAAYESFPTFLRQSGSGLVFTLGMLGSVFAPLIFAEFDDQAGMDRVLMTFSVSSLTAAALIYFCLKETRNCELT